MRVLKKIVLGEKGFLRAILALSATVLSSYHTVVSEGHTGVSYEPDGPEDVRDHHGFEDVQLEVSVGSAYRHGNVVAHHLSRHHRNGLALGRVRLGKKCKLFFVLEVCAVKIRDTFFQKAQVTTACFLDK